MEKKKKLIITIKILRLFKKIDKAIDEKYVDKNK